MQHLPRSGLFDRDAERRCGILIANESRKPGIARADVGSGCRCNRRSPSATAGLLCFVLRADTRSSFSPLSADEMVNNQIFCGHPRETEISGPRLMDWARRIFQKPITGMNRDQTLEKIRVGLKSANYR
jgi:hypothetical protein